MSGTTLGDLPDEIVVEHQRADLAHEPGYAARDPYVERYWLPTLGPTCLVLLRRLALDAQVDPERSETVYRTRDLASTIGVGMPALARSLERLCTMFGLGEQVDAWRWKVRTTVPPIMARHQRRLPAALAAELVAP